VTTPQIVAIGDACLAVLFEQKIDPLVNAHCVALASELERRRLPGVRDVVPAYHTVSIHFDPRHSDRSNLQRELALAVTYAAEAVPPAADLEREPIEIGVTYGGVDGPDLASVAAFASCSEEDVVRLHVDTVYRVYMLGFLPGFAHLGIVHPRIAMPRLDAPRLRVPAGSVGIAGAQSGIYPCDSPGGWRIIGRASAKLFDGRREDPSMLKVGDRVRFVAA
jgi:KipI family sensor histidine kinase inhibitor